VGKINGPCDNVELDFRRPAPHVDELDRCSPSVVESLTLTLIVTGTDTCER
jgi:hypothetical protein